MSGELSERLWREARAVEALVFEAFKGVTREGGVSWHEKDVIDGYGSDEECAAARANDKEKNWEELLSDTKWCSQVGSSAWSFFDAIGFRYYLAPALIHGLRGGDDENLIYALKICSEFQAKWFDLLTPEQRNVVARVLRWRMASEAEQDQGDFDQDLADAYRSGWSEWDRGGGEREDLMIQKGR